MRNDMDRRIYMNDEDPTVVYLKNVVNDPDIQVGEHTYYHDSEKDPRDFLKNNVLYHFPPFTHDTIIIGKYCSIACGTTFICSGACHSFEPLATYPFVLANAHWGLPEEKYVQPEKIWNVKGPTVVGNDVWLGYKSVIMPGVHIGDGAIIGSRAIVTKDVEPYTVVVGTPARPIRKRFDDAQIEKLKKMQWWNLPDEDVQQIAPLLIDAKIDEAYEKFLLLRAANKIVQGIQDCE